MAIGTSIKSAFNAGKKALSSSVTGRTVKGAAQRMGTSSFMKETVAPGLKTAFKQAGGRSGLAKRVVGGAAIGGGVTGTIGALRGDDFLESARSGVVTGALGGLGRQGYQMTNTASGQTLTSNIGKQYARARGEAVDRTAAQSAGAVMRANAPNGPNASEALSNAKSHYQGQSFWDSASADIKNAAGVAKSAGRKTGASSRNVMSNNQVNRAQKPRNMSNQVHTLMRGAQERQAAQQVLNRK